MTTALVAALALTLGACGDDYDSDLVDALKAQGATQEEAECFIDELGEDDAQGFLDSVDAEEAPDDAQKFVDALDECGVEPDEADSGEEPESAPEPAETSAPEADSTEDGDSNGVAIADIASCLEAEGLDVNTDDGPPARIDIIGTGGTGAVFEYADAAQASDASGQFVDTFGGGDNEFVSGSSGTIAFYYLNSSDEATQVEGCLAG